MGKRKRNSKDGASKRFKAGGFIDPSTSGIYATCARGKEQQCRQELMNLFSEKIEQYYTLDEINDESQDEEDAKELSIEDQIKKELSELQDKKDSKKELLKSIDLGCECLVFIKTRKPVELESFVERLCLECMESKNKTTRYTQKLSPITFSVSASIEEVRKLAKRVLEPHFHNEENQKPYKFAIQISKRNFNALPKAELIRTIAECVGREHGHSVDLKKYDKLILVECYKSNVGMSVVNNYDKLEKFNLQQIFEKNAVRQEDDSLSRVKKDNKKEDKKDEEKDNKEEDTTEKDDFNNKSNDSKQ